MQNMKKIIGFLCSMVFCIVIALGKPQMAMSAGGVDINATNFPDSIFRECVSNDFDKDRNHVLSESEIENVIEISVWRRGITSLKGVEYFTALTSLNCSSNQLTELKLNRQTYDKLELSKASLHGSENVLLSDLQNVTKTDSANPIIKVTDPTKFATYKVNGKDFTIIYIDEELDATPVEHFYVDYEYKEQAARSTICIYTNGGNVAEPGSSEKRTTKNVSYIPTFWHLIFIQ